ncbi:hypothetical protein PPERSA_00399 [Pseudocohnilembus persalinus]|uniref:Uncharacterized protein n=1 Tax=Pseudocohnilembus persalinus TaxID=266149 RepID=A0A0V0QYU5_PSEPJ|nr:hypothetical protein PPERSA_00399 [Pseudocohnilembus persalinus]|eukprot:KRX07242.1 hypothetical protein PPERSA_00399 [Pseudocohnilembus persalinus]
MSSLQNQMQNQSLIKEDSCQNNRVHHHLRKNKQPFNYKQLVNGEIYGYIIQDCQQQIKELSKQIFKQNQHQQQQKTICNAIQKFSDKFQSQISHQNQNYNSPPFYKQIHDKNCLNSILSSSYKMHKIRELLENVTSQNSLQSANQQLRKIVKKVKKQNPKQLKNIQQKHEQDYLYFDELQAQDQLAIIKNEEQV